MDQRQIQYFVCLYEEGSVTRAAQRLHIVQPALSMQIAKLEEELGRQLFVRGSKGMTPTEHATHMYALFLPVLADFERARAQLLATSSELAGHARIGLPASIAQDILAPALLAFSSRHPQVRVSVTEAYTQALVQGVAAGQLDAAIVNKPRRLVLKAQPVLRGGLVLVTATSHRPLPAQVGFRQAVKMPLVLPTRQHGLRAIVESACEAAGLQLHCAWEVDSLGASMQLVQQRRELASLLPRTAVRSRLAEGSLRAHRVVGPALARELVCVSHPTRPVAPPAAAFLEVLLGAIRACGRR